MFTCKLDPDSRMTLCEQLSGAIRSAIREGTLSAGAKLPSKRQLSEHLSVSTATVEAAYGRMVEEGWCESRPRSGIYVSCDLPKENSSKDKTPPVRWDFSIGAADAEVFPYATWARLMREVLSEQDRRLLLSGESCGSRQLREEIAGLLYRQRGINASPEQIVLGAGTGVLIASLVGLIGRERLFAVEDPGYGKVRKNLVSSGARILPVPLRDGAMDVRELYSSGAGAAYVTPARQFPTGKEMTAQQRQSLLAWSAETGGLILEDDCDSEFLFSGTAQGALFPEAGNARVIYMNTFARTLAPGLRMSYMVLPEGLVRQYVQMHSTCTIPGFEQETLCKFLSGGYMERHIARMRVIYRGRWQALAREIQNLNLGTVLDGAGGLYLPVRVNGKMPSQELIPAAAAQGVLLSRITDYSVLTTSEQGPEARIVLLGICGMDEEKANEGLRALSQAWL